MKDLLIKLAKIVTVKYPDSSPGVAKPGNYSLGEELYQDKVDPKEKVRKALKKTKNEGKFEDLVVNTLGTDPKSGNNAAGATPKEPWSRGLDS